jgi:hypothetical protein
VKQERAGINMGTTPKSFNDRIETKKGTHGENLVRKHIEKQGWVVYRPVTDKAHSFDMLAIKDKNEVIIIEVKTKARMNKWPATGFDSRSLPNYEAMYLNHNIPVFVAFVDEQLKKAYAGNLHNLLDEYIETADGVTTKYPKRIKTKRNKEIIIFPLSKMKDLFILNEEDIKIMKDLSSRNYDYDFGNNNENYMQDLFQIDAEQKQ